jgi:flagellar motor switch protein FliG
MTIKGVEKAAILMMTLKDEQVIREIFSRLDQSEVYDISLAMTNLGNIESDQVEKVLIEFAHDLNQSLQIVGNVRTAERLLKKVLNENEYNKIFDRIKHANTSSTWDMISNMDDGSVAQFIKYEYPQTTALILSKLPGQKSAKILKLLSKEYAVEVLRRMINLDTVNQDTLTRVERVIESEIGSMSSHFNKQDNISVITEIFNNFSKDEEVFFMNAIREKDEESAEKISKNMLTLEDLLLIKEGGVAAIIQKVDNNTLLAALANAPKEIQDLFLAAMSQRVARMMSDEFASNRFSKKDSAEAQIVMLKIVKKLATDGTISIEKAK